MMDGCALMDFQRHSAFHWHYKAWKNQDVFVFFCFVFFNNLIIRLKEECHIKLGWLQSQ